MGRRPRDEGSYDPGPTPSTCGRPCRCSAPAIRTILARHTALIEPLALNEFYLDVSPTAASIEEAGALARRLKDEVRRETGLTASAGVEPSKFVAKIASDLRKPDGRVTDDRPSGSGYRR
jgi:nucleotidyltransferase/DNA polymerase involved in DNA repair